MPKISKILISGLLCTLLASCSAKSRNADDKDADKKSAKATLVTVTQVKKQSVEITEESVGSLEGLVSPTVAAEVAARVVKVYVRPGEAVKQGQLLATLDAADFGSQRNEAAAEVARIHALMDNQAKVVLRNQALVDKKFISQNAADNDMAQQNALKEQLAGASAHVASINHTSGKTSVRAPVSGVIQKKLVDTGDFVHIGDPIVEIVARQHLLAHLPFPEQIAAKLHAGLKVRLTTPTSTTPFETVIHALKPMVTADNRSVDVVADVVNAAGWQPGASVTGVVVLSAQNAAFMLPEQSVVLRPAGEVVYVVQGNNALQSIVKTGLRQNGMVEIIEGVHENDTVVVDGAGFLTDKALVKVGAATN